MMDIIQKIQEEALEAAVKGDWNKAIEKNNLIIQKNAKDVYAYLRLGFAYLQVGKLSDAKKAYNNALEIQPINQIALMNVEKIKILTSEKQNIGSSSPIDPNLFLNVVGKTKVIELLTLGELAVIARLQVGQPVLFKVKRHRIEIRDKDNNYIGIFPDDISKRLIFFIQEGSEYEIYIKESTKNSVHVFIKEVKKGKTVQKYTSFPKNIQDDLKFMHQDEESDTEEKAHVGSEEDSEEEMEEHEKPIDIEALAEETPSSDYFSDVEVPFEDEAEEEFEE